jgi:peroxiredoxin
MGADALLALAEGKSEIRNPKSEMDESLLTSAATNDGEGRANRFSNRSLARSKIKRDGLKAGTPAPDFRLPRVDGRGELSLEEFRGRRVLLVFSDPHCGPCNSLAPELEKFHRAQMDRDRSPVAARRYAAGDGQLGNHSELELAADGDRPRSAGISVLMISKGEAKENRAKVKELGLTFPVLLQQQWEISRRYAMFATPIAYLIDEAGIVARDVAVGAPAIMDLLLQSTSSALGTGRRSEPQAPCHEAESVGVA